MFWCLVCKKPKLGHDPVLTFSLTSSETVRDSMRQETAQLMMWNRVYMTRVLVEDLTGGQKAQQSEQGAGPQQQHIWGGEGGGRSAFTQNNVIWAWGTDANCCRRYCSLNRSPSVGLHRGLRDPLWCSEAQQKALTQWLRTATAEMLMM